MPTLQPIPLVTISSPNFLLGTAVLIASAIAHTAKEQPFHFYIFHNGLEDTHKEGLKKTVQDLSPISHIDFIEPKTLEGYNRIQEELSHIHIHRFKVPNFTKLLVAQMETPYKHLLFLDSDILIKRDLAELYQKDCPTFNAVLDDHFVKYREESKTASMLTLAKLDPSLPFFNSGVFCVNTEHWKEQKLFDSCIEAFHYYRDYEKTDPTWILGDQIIYNVGYKGAWNAVERHWNRQCPATMHIHHEINEGRECLFHYIGKPKPWDMPEGPENEAFYHYLSMTAFSTYSPPSYWLKWRNRLAYVKYRLHVMIFGKKK